jgi:hypothetical protein
VQTALPPPHQGKRRWRFGVPSLEMARRIDAQDNALAVQAACYRAETKLAKLRALYESEYSRIRTAMLTEIAELELGENEV